MRAAIGIALGGRAQAVFATDSGVFHEDARPAAVGLTPAGEVVVGDGALALDKRQRAIDFVEQLGRPEPFIVAGAPYGSEALVAQLIRALVDGLTAAFGAVEGIALAFPDEFDPYRLDLLAQAARLAAVGDICFVPDRIARAYASDPARGAALWVIDEARANPAGAPAPAGSPVTSRAALLGSGAAAAGAGAALSAGGAAADAVSSAAAFGAGASMGDFGPSMRTFGRRGRSMRAFLAVGVVAAVVVAGAAVVFAARGGDSGDDDVDTRAVATTRADEPDLDDPIAVAAAIKGTFLLTTTVIDGNSSHPVGNITTFTLEVSSSCSGDECEVEIENVGSTSVGPGGVLRFSGAANEPCTNDPSITVLGSYEIVLRAVSFDDAGAVSRIEGTNNQTITDLAGCPHTEIDPISFEWVMTRA